MRSYVEINTVVAILILFTVRPCVSYRVETAKNIVEILSAPVNSVMAALSNENVLAKLP